MEVLQEWKEAQERVSQFVQDALHNTDDPTQLRMLEMIAAYEKFHELCIQSLYNSNVAIVAPVTRRPVKLGYTPSHLVPHIAGYIDNEE